MSLYPSLEDMKVDHMAQAQAQHEQQVRATAHAIAYPQGGGGGPPPAYGTAPPAYGAAPPTAQASSLYPSLDDYIGNMGIQMTPENMAVVAAHQDLAVYKSGYDQKDMSLCPAYGENGEPSDMQVATRPSAASMQIAPISGESAGLKRAEIRQGIREVILCKDGEGKIGLRVRSVNKGIFVAFVHVNSPAALGGLRFGDQILQINGQNVAGWDTDKAMKFLSKADAERITFAVRDRPFERTITMQKDSTNHIGFVFKDGRITALVKDSSAARNGVLTEHQLVEVNGQNVVGMKDNKVGDVIGDGGKTITITIIPSFLYDHIVKSMGSSLIKKFMDHSIPDA